MMHFDIYISYKVHVLVKDLKSNLIKIVNVHYKIRKKGFSHYSSNRFSCVNYQKKGCL